MYFRSLEVTNFRAITHASLDDLSSMVVVAGPNGCGKSSLFDAIRLLKSSYGQYQQNEFQQWLAEFQINLQNDPSGVLSLFQNPNKDLRIALDVVLEQAEKEYIQDNVPDLLQPPIWRKMVPGIESFPLEQTTSLATQLRQHSNEDKEDEANLIIQDLEKESFLGEIVIHPDLSTTANESRVLELVFGHFLPQHIGIVDYHGEQRVYQREQIANINLNAQSTEQQLSQYALYNYSNKYSNIKTEMAASYVRDLLAQEFDKESSSTEPLMSTLQELFDTFFPGKTFLGPRPTRDGKLTFPVVTQSGFQHDINELSSGEKEVLYGYLRLRSVAPRHSVLLLDEPELHLNPRLIQGLPQFYYKHLGRALDNQIWLMTHSDALLREALGNNDFSVFHMQVPDIATEGANQATRINVTEEVEKAIIDLVGDLATYRPGAKVVVFEGGGDSEFDLYMVNTLFPEFQTSVNAISGGNKSRVRALHTLLDKAQAEGIVSERFFSIVDRDSDEYEEDKTGATALKWDAYHIENYLLEPRYILEVLRDALGSQASLSEESEVTEALRACAEETLPDLVRHQLENDVNQQLVRCIHTKVSPDEDNIAHALRETIEASQDQLTHEVEALSLEKLRQKETGARIKFTSDLTGGTWKSNFRGRDILRRFVGHHCGQTKYEVFRNLVLAKMRDDGYAPAGMKKVIGTILEA